LKNDQRGGAGHHREFVVGLAELDPRQVGGLGVVLHCLQSRQIESPYVSSLPTQHDEKDQVKSPDWAVRGEASLVRQSHFVT
jgi:hypothetical protein